MAYFAPYIDSAGLHVPSYNDILDDLISLAKQIYGSDIYLENDSMDYQYLSAVALKNYDAMQGLLLAYNSRSPSCAIGTALSSLVKINGLSRKSASYSTCQVTLTGTAGTVIPAGKLQDTAGNSWSIPTNTTIPAAGVITVSAVCDTIGEIAALVGDITKIATPQYGWISATNTVAAVPGQPVETDAELRARQAISTSIPSQTLREGIIASIASISGVTRYKVYENDTSDNTVTENNPLGLPEHCIAAVVEGGTDNAIANQIRIKKGPGCYTHGTTQIDVTGEYDVIDTIRFFRPTYVDVDVNITIKTYTGYTTAIIDSIKNNIVSYLNGLNIGDDMAVSLLSYAAQAANSNVYAPVFSISSITAARHGEAQSAADIVTDYYEVLQGNINNINVSIAT